MTEQPSEPSQLPLRAQSQTPGANGGAAPNPEVTDALWEQVGGTEVFERLVQTFYRGVREDPELNFMYPQDDWDGAIWRLRTFLEQYWGGPKTYSEQRGHPRLRMRHSPYPITPRARDRWLHHMNAALDEAALPPLQDAAFRDYVDRAAHSMVNQYEL